MSIDEIIKILDFKETKIGGDATEYVYKDYRIVIFSHNQHFYFFKKGSLIFINDIDIKYFDAEIREKKLNNLLK